MQLWVWMPRILTVTRYPSGHDRVMDMKIRRLLVKMIRKHFRIGWCILFLLLLGSVVAGDEPAPAADKPFSHFARYYPLTIGNEYYYKAFRRDEPNREYQVKAEVRNLQTVGGKDYFYFFAPGADIRYLVRRDESGVFMRRLKREIPLFGISFNVHLMPELLFLRFPLTVGDQWSQQVVAKARILFIPVSRTIEGRFHVVDRQVLRTEAGDIDAFIVNASLGPVNGPMTNKTFWYGADVGYIKADAPEDFTVLVGYRVLDEQAGIWIDKTPLDAARYK